MTGYTCMIFGKFADFIQKGQNLMLKSTNKRLHDVSIKNPLIIVLFI